MSQTQTDLIELGYAPARQPNTAKIRTWEIAGTAHADAYTVGAAASILGCTTPVNSGPQHNVVQAAFTAFDKWVDNGTPPPSPPPFKLSSTEPPTLALDAHGNVIGGVRTPAVDVPVSTLSGAPARRRHHDLRPLRVHRGVHPGPAGQPLRDPEQLHRRLHQELGQGHCRGLHPRAGQGLAAGGRRSRCRSPLPDAGQERAASAAKATGGPSASRRRMAVAQASGEAVDVSTSRS